MSTSTTTPNRYQRKIPIPSPLPHHRGQLAIPSALKQNILAALAANGSSVPDIQSGMNEALAGFLQELAGFVERVLEEQDGEGGEGEGYGNDEGTGDGMMGEEMGHGIMNGEEIMRKVVDALTVGGRKGEGKDEAEGKLVISEDVVEKIVQGVRREVEGVVKCVDGEGWVG